MPPPSEIRTRSNISNNKNNITNIRPSKADGHDVLFEEFYALYPKKQKRKEALRAWVKIKSTETKKTIIDDVIKRTEKYWNFKDKQFIPAPSTYLNGERWLDEIITETFRGKEEVIRPKLRNFTDERLAKEEEENKTRIIYG